MALLRFYGVFAPNSRWRTLCVPEPHPKLEARCQAQTGARATGLLSDVLRCDQTLERLGLPTKPPRRTRLLP